MENLITGQWTTWKTKIVISKTTCIRKFFMILVYFQSSRHTSIHTCKKYNWEDNPKGCVRWKSQEYCSNRKYNETKKRQFNRLLLPQFLFWIVPFFFCSRHFELPLHSVFSFNLKKFQDPKQGLLYLRSAS